MTGRPWAGDEVRRARAYWRGQLPVTCCRCGKPVLHDPAKPHGGWQVDHWPVSREMGGTQTWPAHSHCNLSAGGKRGAQITNTLRQNLSAARRRSRRRNIRGA